MKTLNHLIMFSGIVFVTCLPALSQAGVPPHLNAHGSINQAAIGAAAVTPAAELTDAHYLAANDKDKSNNGNGNGNGNGLGNGGVDNPNGNNGNGNNGNGLGLGNGGHGNGHGNGNDKPKPSKCK